jgi:hypothetical protein
VAPGQFEISPLEVVVVARDGASQSQEIALLSPAFGEGCNARAGRNTAVRRDSNTSNPTTDYGDCGKGPFQGCIEETAGRKKLLPADAQ